MCTKDIHFNCGIVFLFFLYDFYFFFAFLHGVLKRLNATLFSLKQIWLECELKCKKKRRTVERQSSESFFISSLVWVLISGAAKSNIGPMVLLVSHRQFAIKLPRINRAFDWLRFTIEIKKKPTTSKQKLRGKKSSVGNVKSIWCKAKKQEKYIWMFASYTFRALRNSNEWNIHVKYSWLLYKRRLLSSFGPIQRKKMYVS